MEIVLTKAEQQQLKQPAFAWASQEAEVLCFLDSNQYNADPYSQYEALLAVGVYKECLVAQTGQAFERLKAFAEAEQEWLFGHFNYDLKNETEALSSKHPDGIGFPELYFFVPQHLLLFHKDGRLSIQSKTSSPASIWTAIQQTASLIPSPVHLHTPIQQRISKATYLATLDKIHQHIVDGDSYELNFCQEFYTHAKVASPALFTALNELAKAPFSCYYQLREQHLLCGSPERFLCKRGQQLISQPIKGTIKRGFSRAEDIELQRQLRQSKKDQAENVMIVDLVRNDLTKSCETGSIKVEELFGIYQFENVFQMISTVVGTLRSDQHWVDAIRAAFPMGSMTGAPKVISMQLIEEYERSKRGLYSGAVGYISPDRDFDFNVVIRSILYQSAQEYLSFQVGGAIVYDSDPVSEYEECLLKASTMLRVLGEQQTRHN